MPTIKAFGAALAYAGEKKYPAAHAMHARNALRRLSLSVTLLFPATITGYSQKWLRWFQPHMRLTKTLDLR
jgi:hypothetical protein